MRTLFDTTLLLCCTPNPAVLSVFLVGLSRWGHWDSGIISDSLVWEPTASCVALQNQKAFARTNCPLIISTTKVKCVSSFRERELQSNGTQ